MVGKCLVGIYAVNVFFFFLKAQNLILPLNLHHYEQIAVDEQKNIYLLNSQDATLSKLFFKQNYDSVLVIGGKNLSLKESFIQPSELIIPDSKTIFVIDLFANDIKLLNTNLKIQKIWNFNQIKEEYQPFQLQTAVILPTGEMFIQNKLNSMIYRVNVFGEIDRQLGGNNFAEASITDYAQLASTKEWLFIWVKTEKKLYQWDHNGNFKKSFQFSENFENIVSDKNNLWLYQKSQIYYLYNYETLIYLFEHKNSILDLYLFDNQMYILDKMGVWQYDFKKSK